MFNIHFIKNHKTENTYSIYQTDIWGKKAKKIATFFEKQFAVEALANLREEADTTEIYFMQ